ncbi:MAG: hypothetical protein ABJA78_08770 [Ferruginibacter sp.]
MRIAKYLFFLCLLFTRFQSYGQDTLPHINVINYNGRIVVSWLSNYNNPINNITIQRSFDSLKNYTTIGSVLNPQNRENGYADVKPPYNKMYYRVFISFSGGTYLFSQVKRPVKDTARAVEDVDGTVKPIDSIIAAQETPKPKGWISSRTVYTGKDNNIIINLPDAMVKKYSLKIFDEEMLPAFTISRISDVYLTLERANFVHSGWFYFELLDNGTVIEKNKFYVPKDAKSPVPVPEE